MTEKIAFNYKRVTKGDINDHVFDNYDNEYIYLKRDNSIIIFKNYLMIFVIILIKMA